MFLRLVDELNSNDEGEWRTNSQASLDDIDLKLLAAFGPSSQQDMQVGSTCQLLCALTFGVLAVTLLTSSIRRCYPAKAPNFGARKQSAFPCPMSLHLTLPLSGITTYSSSQSWTSISWVEIEPVQPRRWPSLFEI